MDWVRKIKEKLKDGEPCFEDELRSLIEGDKAIISGYLKCLVDLEQIDMKKQGNSKIYFIKRGNKR
jgi:hypothetical protein